MKTIFNRTRHVTKARAPLPEGAGLRTSGVGAALGLAFFAALAGASPVRADPVQENVIQAPENFVTAAFAGRPADTKVLWLTKDLQAAIAGILGHPLPMLRLRYWRAGDRTAWILEETGKEYPITAGFVVENERLAEAAVLVYRESRGWEIRYPAFRNQFVGAMLDDRAELDRNIDGISGATLSVNAMQRMARLALFLHDRVADTAKSSGMQKP